MSVACCCRVDLARVTLVHPHVPLDISQRLGMPALEDVVTEQLDPRHPLQALAAIQASLPLPCLLAQALTNGLQHVMPFSVCGGLALVYPAQSTSHREPKQSNLALKVMLACALPLVYCPA